METIAQYGSSDEDESYKSPSSGTQNVTAAPKNTTSNRVDPSNTNALDHKGRIRSFPHVAGNYAVHVFVNVAVPEPCRSALETLLQRATQLLPSLRPITDSIEVEASPSHLPGPLAQPSYHVSLSRTVPLRLPEAEDLLTSLRNSLVTVEPFTLTIHPTLQVFVNDESTRTFLALKTSAVPSIAAASLALRQKTHLKDPILRSIDAVSDVFEIHDLPRFYSEPKPHISIAWLLGDASTDMTAAIENDRELAALVNQLKAIEWNVEPQSVLCKVGRKEHIIWRRK